MARLRAASAALLLALVGLSASEASARAGGYAVAPGVTSCKGCHTGSDVAPGIPTVMLTGPAALAPGAKGTYSLSIAASAGGPTARAGLTVYVSAGTATLTATDTAKTKLDMGQLVNSNAAAMSAGRITYSWDVTAPATPSTFTLTAIGLACNGSGSGGDKENFKTLTVSVGGAQAGVPTIAKAASAVVDPKVARKVNLSVLGADDGGEAALTYTWGVQQGPGEAQFTGNGTNAGKESAATFTADGTYVLVVTVEDADKHRASANLTLNIGLASDAPIISLLLPGQGAISRVVSLRAEVDAPEGVDRVTFSADGAEIVTIRKPPYVTIFDTRLLENGKHVLAVSATDAAGKLARSEVAVEVLNLGEETGAGTGCASAPGAGTFSGWGWLAWTGLLLAGRRRFGAARTAHARR